MLRGVIFDLGDTLQEYNRRDWDAIVAELNRALYAYLEERGEASRLPPLDEFLELVNTRSQAGWEEARRTLRGHSMVDMLQGLLDEHRIDSLSAEDCLPRWYGQVTGISRVQPDVIPTLQSLRECGLKLGLVSNTGWPAAAHDLDLEKFGIKDLLNCRFYSCEVGWEKPAPQIFLTALDCLGLKPEEAVFVGDFLRYDVAGAHGVGMKAIWKRVPDRPPEADDLSVKPDGIITRIGELPGVLEELYGPLDVKRET